MTSAIRATAALGLVWPVLTGCRLQDAASNPGVEETLAGGVMPIAEYRDRVEMQRRSRLVALTRPTGWLSVTQFAWLESGTNTIGASPGHRVVLPTDAPADAGRIDVSAEAIVFVAAPGATVRDDSDQTIGRLLLTPGEPNNATAFHIGRYRLFVSRFGDRVALRIQDPDNPARTAFPGIEYFPVDPRWRVPARIESYPAPRTLPVPIFASPDGEARSGGVLVFQMEAQEYRLELLRPNPGADWLFTIFTDGTSSTETYPGGRFVWAERTSVDGRRAIIDFNAALNPPCAFTPHALCELAPAQNRLDLPVRAGEKRYIGSIAAPRAP